MSYAKEQKPLCDLSLEGGNDTAKRPKITGSFNSCLSVIF
jgi:hypothetical protein